MGTTVVLIMFGVSLAAGAAIDCDKNVGLNGGAVIPNQFGDYVNININEHHPALVTSGIPARDIALAPGRSGHFAHHGTNVFFKPHIVMSSGNIPVEQPSISIISGSEKFDSPLTLIPQPLPELPLIASEPEPLNAPTPQPPIIQPIMKEPSEEVYNDLPSLIPPAPELPPLQLPIVPVPIVLEKKPIIEQVPFIEPIPQSYPEPSFIADLPEPLVVLVPESPVTHPVISEQIEEINKTLLVIPPAPELPPLQLPTLPVPIVIEEKPILPDVQAESTEIPIVATTQREIENSGNDVPEAPVLPSSTHVIHEESPKQVISSIISNNIEGVKYETEGPVIASPGMNFQPFFVAEYPQYPFGANNFQVGVQKELVIQPCPPQGFQPTGLIQTHNYFNGSPQALPLPQLFYKK